MAIPHFNASVLSRSGTGKSAVAAGAYRHNTRMKSLLDGQTYDYSRKNDLVHSEVSLPENAPEWARELFGDTALGRLLDGREATDSARFASVAELSSSLWNSVERHEAEHNRRHASAQLARKFTISLPVELSLEQQIELTRDYIKRSFTDRGMVADWVIHDPDGKKHANPHVHIMTTMRDLNDDKWGLKRRDWNSRNEIHTWRFEWASHVNQTLEREGFNERIDHRSYVNQGIEIEPTSYDPHVAENAEKAGLVARNKELALEAVARNEAFLKENPEHILTVLGARQTIFTEGDIRRALMGRMSVSADELEGFMKRVMADQALVQLEDQTPDGKVQFTTWARVALENNLIVDAMDLASQHLEVDAKAGLELLSTGLKKSQRAAAEEMLGSQRITLVTGFAGTGKTHTLRDVTKVWESRGYEVIGGAASGKATQELSSVQGMENASVAAWEARWARGRIPSSKFVFILDEAAMVGSDVWMRVQEQVAAKGGKFIAIGDPEQLQPVNDTNAFLAVQNRIGVTVMDEIIRQNNPLEREATRLFALGKQYAKTAIRYYHGEGHVHFTQGVDSAIQDIADAYFENAASPDNRIAVALSNKDVWALNDEIRSRAIAQGAVVDTRNYGQIERIERNYDGQDKRVLVDFDIGIGERLLFTKPHRSLRIPKSSLGTVTAVRNGEIDLLLDGDDKRQVTINMTEFSDFDYGFATTIHKSQGMSVDHAFVLGHGYMNQHLAYVAMTRHHKSVDFYAPTNRIENIEALEKIVQRKGYLEFPVEDTLTRIHARTGAGYEREAFAARPDFKDDAQPFKNLGFESDPLLAGVISRISGLLASEYVQGDPIFGEDVRGYGSNPTRVIDDLIANRSAFTAADVANLLSGVVKEPETFMRLFRQAMAHPDLIVLRDEAGADGTRVYSTGAQIALELDVVDRAARLALLSDPKANSIEPGREVKAAEDFDLSDMQFTAILAAAAERFSIVSGPSGSGKTRLAAAIGSSHEARYWDVHRIAPTGVGADNFREACKFKEMEGTVRTLASLEYAIEQGTVELGPKSIVILDEAGQVGAESADRLLRLIEESGAKFVAFRDNDQVGPYEAGPIFQALEKRIGGIELDVSHRSQNPAMIKCLDLLSDPLKSAERRAVGLAEAGILHGGGTRKASVDLLAAAYVEDRSQSKIVLAHSRADVDALNTAIRARLDSALPERNLDADMITQGGALGELRLRDKIVLSKAYQTNAGWLRAGTTFEVERRTADEVILRHGEGQEAQFVKVATKDDDFEYRFEFASTVHGSKGRSIDSVHMLATPGMSRNLFKTGVGLHRHSLNVVLPTTENNVVGSMRAILQTDDTPRSVFDYGFDASQHARAVMGNEFGSVENEPSKLVDGFNRMVDWVADGLDGGAGREDSEMPTRAVRLRVAVVAELIAARGEHGFSTAERHKLEHCIDKLIHHRAWSRLLGIERETKSDAPIGSAQDRMVARILERGAQAAEASNDAALRDWFKLASHGLTQRVETEMQMKQDQEDQSIRLKTAIKEISEEETRLNFARAMASSISRHIDETDDVHLTPDLVGKIEHVLRGVAAEIPKLGPELEKAAIELAFERRKIDVKKEVVDEMVRGRGLTEHLYISHAVYRDKNPFRFTNHKQAAAYTQKLEERIGALDPETTVVKDMDIIVAAVKMADPSNRELDSQLSRIMTKVTSYEVSTSDQGRVLYEDRDKILEELARASTYDRSMMKEIESPLLKRLYNSFTQSEIRNLADPHDTSKPLLEAKQHDKAAIVKTLGNLAQANPGLHAPHHSARTWNTMMENPSMSSPSMSMY